MARAPASLPVHQVPVHVPQGHRVLHRESRPQKKEKRRNKVDKACATQEKVQVVARGGLCRDRAANTKRERC